MKETGRYSGDQKFSPEKFSSRVRETRMEWMRARTLNKEQRRELWEAVEYSGKPGGHVVATCPSQKMACEIAELLQASINFAMRDKSQAAAQQNTAPAATK